MISTQKEKKNRTKLRESSIENYYEVIKSDIQSKNFTDAYFTLLKIEIKDPHKTLYMLMSYISLKLYNIKQGLYNLKKALNCNEREDLSSFFNLQELFTNLFIKDAFILKKESQEIKFILEKLDIYIDLFDTSGLNDELSQKGFQYIYESNYEKAIEYLESAKSEKGFQTKYPKLNNLSIKDWYEEYPNMDALLEVKKSELNEELSSSQDYIDIAKMYLLKNDYSNASLFFTKARDLFLSQKKI